jgi:hypothetical protein
MDSIHLLIRFECALILALLYLLLHLIVHCVRRVPGVHYVRRVRRVPGVHYVHFARFHRVEYFAFLHL